MLTNSVSTLRARRRPLSSATARRVVLCLLMVTVGCRSTAAISDETPSRRGALAWFSDGHLVVGYFVQCAYEYNNRVFTSIDVYKDGQLVWRASASGSPLATVDSVEIGVAPHGFVGTTFDGALLDEIMAPLYKGQLGVFVTTAAGDTYSGSLNLAERDRATGEILLWGGQLTKRSAVTCAV